LHLQPKTTLFPYTTLFRSESKVERWTECDPVLLITSETSGNLSEFQICLRQSFFCQPSQLPISLLPFLFQDSPGWRGKETFRQRSEEHTSELQSPDHLVCS